MPAISTVLENRYRLDALIGSGGMADVYRAHDVRLGRDVAVKVLRDVEHERRFEVETQTLAMLDHPNLVRLLDAGSDDGHLYLVMELLEGASVHELLGQGPVEPSRVAAVGRDAAAALAFIHERGIVHRDVKPSNLMFDDRGTLHLADFGIVRLLGGATLTGTHQTIGTMAYLAPEQLRASAVGPPADVYALGLVLLECLTGRRAFDGSPAETGAARLTRDPDVPGALPAPWPALVRAMTARDEVARPTAAMVHDRLAAPADARMDTRTAVLPPHAAAAGAAAAAAAATVPASVEPISAREPLAPSAVAGPVARPRSRVAMITTGVVVAAALAAGAWWIARDDTTGSPAPAITSTTGDVPTTGSPAPTTPSAPATTATTTAPTTSVAPTTTVVDEPDNPNEGRGSDGPGNGRGKGGRGNEGEGGGEEDD